MSNFQLVFASACRIHEVRGQPHSTRSAIQGQCRAIDSFPLSANCSRPQVDQKQARSTYKKRTHKVGEFRICHGETQPAARRDGRTIDLYIDVRSGLQAGWLAVLSSERVISSVSHFHSCRWPTSNARPWGLSEYSWLGVYSWLTSWGNWTVWLTYHGLHDESSRQLCRVRAAHR